MNMENNKPIDFVMIWVDGSDPEWRKEKSIEITKKRRPDLIKDN